MLKKFNRVINKLEILLGRKKLWSYPRYVQLEPTNRCNQKCIMCPRNKPDYDAPFGDMSFENYKKILDQIPHITNLQLNGLGEPLLHPQFIDMVKEAKKRNISVSINTNLMPIDSIAKAKQLVDSGLDVLKISMDTADAQIYNDIRQSDTFNKVIQAIKLVVQASRGSHSKPRIWFNSIIMQKNYKQLGDILKLGEKLGIDLVRFKPVDTFDIFKEKGIKIISKDDLFKVIKDTIWENKDLKIAHNLQDLLDDFSTYYRPIGAYPCFSPWLELYIQYYGGVRLCCEFYSKKDDVGNMLEKKFRKIWNNKKMQQIRKEFKKGNTYFPVCQTCNRFQRNLIIQQKIKKTLGG